MSRWKWTLTLCLVGTLSAAPLFAQFRFDMTVLTTRLTADPPLTVIDANGLFPSALMELNALELFARVGTQTQTRRAASFSLELQWPSPPTAPLTMLRIDIDRSQFGTGGQYILFPLDPLGQNVVPLDPDTRAVLMRSRARAQRLDANGNPTQQQGTVEIVVIDSRVGGPEVAAILYYEGSAEAPSYTFEYLAIPQNAEFFIHRRIAP